MLWKLRLVDLIEFVGPCLPKATGFAESPLTRLEATLPGPISELPCCRVSAAAPAARSL